MQVSFNELINHENSDRGVNLNQGWATPGSHAELGIRACFSGTRARP